MRQELLCRRTLTQTLQKTGIAAVISPSSVMPPICKRVRRDISW